MRKSIDNVNQLGTALAATAKATAADDDVLELIHAVMHRYRSQQYRFLRDGPHDITHMDGKVLGFFGRHPGATQSDLAQHSGRDKAQLARLIKGMRDRGLLAAEADESDRRNVRLSLTAQGQSVQAALRQQARRLSARAVDGLSPADQQQLMALLRRVNSNLEGL
jgi:DNA-binding MarR family transcriptional regulator